MRVRNILLTLGLLLGLAGAGLAAMPNPVDLSWGVYRLPQSGLVAVLWVTPKPGFKTYAHEPGQSGMPLSAQVVLGPTGKALPVLYPKGETGPDPFTPSLSVNIYHAPTPLFIPLPQDLGPEVSLQAKVSLVACDNKSCWPLSLDASLALAQAPNPAQAEKEPWWPVLAGLAGTSPEVAPQSPLAKAVAEAPAYPFYPRPFSPGLEVGSLAKAIPLALLAGFILNLMPCVLPVICLKLTGLTAIGATARDHGREVARHSLFFALGILVFFLALAVILGLAHMAWGGLFQSQGFILGAAMLLFAMGLSLFGTFHLPVVNIRSGGPGRDTSLGSFVTGLLATALATPCSGPFLGGVLAWTMPQPVAVVMTVFFCLGLGMAAPYLLLAAKPRLARIMPRPGAWMQYVEMLAGFLLMASCLYFLNILPKDMLPAALVALLATGMACYAWGHLAGPSRTPAWNLLVRGAALVVVLAVGWWSAIPPAPAPEVWQAFEPQAFEAELGAKRVLLDFTADWCPNCKVLEKTVLTSEHLAKLQAKYGFTAVKVDLTQQDPKAMNLLKALGSVSIPVTALFPAGPDSSRPVILRDLYTGGQLDEALGQAFP